METGTSAWALQMYSDGGGGQAGAAMVSDTTARRQEQYADFHDSLERHVARCSTAKYASNTTAISGSIQSSGSLI